MWAKIRVGLFLFVMSFQFFFSDSFVPSLQLGSFASVSLLSLISSTKQQQQQQKPRLPVLLFRSSCILFILLQLHANNNAIGHWVTLREMCYSRVEAQWRRRPVNDVVAVNRSSSNGKKSNSFLSPFVTGKMSTSAPRRQQRAPSTGQSKFWCDFSRGNFLYPLRVIISTCNLLHFMYDLRFSLPVYFG